MFKNASKSGYFSQVRRLLFIFISDRESAHEYLKIASLSVISRLSIGTENFIQL